MATVETEDEVRALETVFIRMFDTYRAGYNCNEGGSGWLVIPDDVRKKIGDAQRGKVISAECRAKISAASRGRSVYAKLLGAHTQKGDANPRAKAYLVRLPNGTEQVVSGLRAFCRETGAFAQSLRRGNCSKGYTIIRKLLSSDAAYVGALTGTGAI